VTDTALDTGQATPADESAVAPLRRAGFRAAWTALAGSQLVIWMNTVGAVTVIAALSDSPTLIALVQTANSVPAVLLALVMGSMADIVDRRRFAVASQSWMLVSVAALAALTLTDAITPGLTLALTFALGAGMATTFVIYQALTQDFVPRSELMAAVALNGVAINLARAAGPALAGFVIAALSAGALFALGRGCSSRSSGSWWCVSGRPGRCVRRASASRRRCGLECDSSASRPLCAPYWSAARCSPSRQARSGRFCRSWHWAGSGCQRAASGS
jgi:MFS family permease